jgi:putative flavoprotein involved in K+ transport
VEVIRMGVVNDVRRIETVVVGAGQAGLSVGYHLARRGLRFVILDANDRIGDAWRRRWDSLRLFTPARFNGLDGMRFPGAAHSFSTKDEVADYLESYAARFELPVETGVRIERLSRNGDTYLLAAGEQRFEAANVVVAVSSYQVPRTPAFASSLSEDVVQMHSVAYRNIAQLQKGRVLVVGVGNSGAEIAIDVAKSHPTWLAGTESGGIPFRIDSVWARYVLLPLIYRVIGHRVLTVRTPIGRRVRPRMLGHAAPLLRVRPADLAAAGINRVGRVVGSRDGYPVLADGSALAAENVIWCTGFGPDFSWIDLPVFGEEKEPKEPIHVRGVVAGEPGLYFVGLHFLYAMSSGFLPGVGRDAEYVVDHIASRRRR